METFKRGTYFGLLRSKTAKEHGYLCQVEGIDDEGLVATVINGNFLITLKPGNILVVHTPNGDDEYTDVHIGFTGSFSEYDNHMYDYNEAMLYMDEHWNNTWFNRLVSRIKIRLVIAQNRSKLLQAFSAAFVAFVDTYQAQEPLTDTDEDEDSDVPF